MLLNNVECVHEIPGQLPKRNVIRSFAGSDIAANSIEIGVGEGGISQREHVCGRIGAFTGNKRSQDTQVIHGSIGDNIGLANSGSIDCIGSFLEFDQTKQTINYMYSRKI
jgi:hypothetical protein